MNALRELPEVMERSRRAVVARWWACLLLPATAVAGPFLSFFPGSSGMPYAYRLLFVAMCVVAIPLAFTAPVRRERLVWWFTGIVIVWATLAPLSLLWSPAPRAGFPEIAASGMSAFGAWVTLLLTRGEDRMIDRMRAGWIIGLAAGVVLAILETIFDFNLVSVTRGITPKFVNVWILGFRHSPNDFAATMVVGCIAAMAYLLRHVTKWTLIGVPLAIIATGYIVLGTGSRAALVVLALAALLCLVWLLFGRVSRGERAKRAAVIFVSLMIALTLNGELPGTQTVPQDITTAMQKRASKSHSSPLQEVMVAAPVNQAAQKAQQQSSDSKRVDLSVLGLRYVQTSPIVGHGAGYWQYEQPKDHRTKYRWPESLHNGYLQMTVAYGLLGVLPVILLLCTIAWRLLRRPLRVSLRDPRVFEIFAISALHLAFSVMGSYVLGDAVFWLSLAYATALTWSLGRRPAEDVTGGDRPTQDAVDGPSEGPASAPRGVTARDAQPALR